MPRGTSARSLNRVPAGLGIATPLALLGLAALVVWLAPLEFGINASLSAANLAVCLVGIIYAFFGGLRPVAMMFFVFSFSWLAFAPVYQLVTGRLAWGDAIANHPASQITATLAMNLTFSVTFLLTHLLVSRRLGRMPIERPRREWKVSGAYLFGLGAFSVLVSANAVVQIGGIGVLFSSRGDRWEALEQASFTNASSLADAVTRVLPAALAMAFSVLTVLWIRQTRGEQKAVRFAHVGSALLSFALLLSFANPLTASRFIAVTAWGAVALTIFRPRSQRAGIAVAVGGLVGVLLVYPFANIFRQGANTSLDAIRTGLEAFVGPDFDGFQQVANALAFVEARGHSLGQYTLSAGGFFVPRSIWADKAIPASIDVATNAGYWFTNLSLPFHAEMFIEFGFVGMMLATALLAFLAARCDEAWQHKDLSRSAAVAPYLAFAVFGILRGPLGSLVPIYLTAILIILVGVRKAGGISAVKRASVRESAASTRVVGTD